jgi:predicted nucleic-acid-binding protein
MDQMLNILFSSEYYNLLKKLIDDWNSHQTKAVVQLDESGQTGKLFVANNVILQTKLLGEG